MNSNHGKLLDPLRVRNFRFLWIGQAVSLIGEGGFTVVLAWAVYSMSSSPVLLSTVLVARTVPMVVLLLIGGAVSDHLPRRIILIATDLLRAGGAGILSLLAATSLLETWHLVVVGILFGVSDAFFYPAHTAIIPDLLEANLLARGNALYGGTKALALRLLGPGASGLLIAAFGIAATFAAVSAGFLVSAFCTFLVNTSNKQRGIAIGFVSRRTIEHLFSEVRVGVTYCMRERWILWTLVAAGVTTLASNGPLQVLLPLLAIQNFGLGAKSYGLVLASIGAGGIAATIFVYLRGLSRRFEKIYIAWALAMLAVVGIAVLPSMPLAMLFGLLAGYGLQFGGIGWTTSLQERVPRELVARVSSVDWIVSYSLQPVSVALAGVIGTVLGPALTLAVGGFVGAITMAIGIIGIQSNRFRGMAKSNEPSAQGKSWI